MPIAGSGLPELTPEFTRGADQLVDNAWFKAGMTGIRDDIEFRRRPGLAKPPGAREGRHDVIAPVHDTTGCFLQLLAGFLKQPAILFEEALIDEIVAFDAGEGVGEIIFHSPLAARCSAASGVAQEAETTS